MMFNQVSGHRSLNQPEPNPFSRNRSPAQPELNLVVNNNNNNNNNNYYYYYSTLNRITRSDWMREVQLIPNCTQFVNGFFLPNKELLTVKHAHQCMTKPARLTRDKIFDYNESISSILLSVL